MGGGGGAVVDVVCTPAARGKYNKVCRQLVKEPRIGPINCVTPCKHNSLSVKKWLVDGPLLTMTHEVEL